LYRCSLRSGVSSKVQFLLPGASKGTPGDAKCVTEILGGDKNKEVRGTEFKIVATRCHILRLKCTKFDFGWSSAADPAGELTALPQTP